MARMQRVELVDLIMQASENGAGKADFQRHVLLEVFLQLLETAFRGDEK